MVPFSIALGICAGLLILVLLLRKGRRKEPYIQLMPQEPAPALQQAFRPGEEGEQRAYDCLVQLPLPPPRYLLRNILTATATEEAAETEIDLILLHTSGIYVIEVKDHSGWIFGSARDKTWTQSIRKRDGTCVKYQFYNPLRQNYGHVQALRQDLAFFGELPMHPVVVFSGKCELKKLALADEPVVTLSQLPQLMMCKAMQYGGCLSDDDVEVLYEFLSPLLNPSPERMEEHLRFVEEKSRAGIKI